MNWKKSNKFYRRRKNTKMKNSLEAILVLTPWVSLVIGSIFLLRRIARRHIAPGCFRLLWLMLGLRMLLPFRFIRVQRIPASEETVIPLSKAAAILQHGIMPKSVPDFNRVLPSPAELIPWIWAAGALFYLLAHLIPSLHFTHKLQREAIPDGEFHGVPVWRTHNLSGPVTAGLFRSAIYLPLEGWHQERPYVLAHEFQHVRHRDTLMQLMLLAAVALNWFNPLAHFMMRGFREDAELACDAAALNGQSMSYRLAYGQAVLSALKKVNRSTMLSASMSGESFTTRRFKEMFQMKVNRKFWPSLLGMALVLTVISGMTAKTQLAAGEDKEPLPEGPSIVLEESTNESTSDSALSEETETTSVSEESTPRLVAWPVPDYTNISAEFGERGHEGVDLAAPAGSPVLSATDGTVVETGQDFEKGLYLIVADDNMKVRYNHCQEILVEKGSTLSAGDLVALVGSTGYATGPHCHLEVKQDGTLVDPLSLVTAP